MVSEATVRKWVREWHEKDGRGFLFAIPATRYSMRGLPDFALIHRGMFIGLECKTEIGRLSGAQKLCLANIQKSQGFVKIIRDKQGLEQLSKLLDSIELLHDNHEPLENA
jgi:hypothetical protein